MIELRWLVKTEPVWGDKMLETPVYGVRSVLQFRVRYDKTVYAGFGPYPEELKEMVWSDWQDVPKVPENG